MRKREQSSFASSSAGASGRRMRMLSALAFVVVATACSPKVVVQPPPPCPEPSEAVMDEMQTRAPGVFQWFWDELDPYCEAIFAAWANFGGR